eukprot:6200292-Ditylum_brightwellii.AAC.1
MKRYDKLHTDTINAVYPANGSLPNFIQQSLNINSCTMISTNQYDEHNINDMMWKCTCLRSNVTLTFKPGAKPFCSQSYTIPMAIEKIACKKIQKLPNAAILGKGSQSPWGAPCLFQGKKDGGLHFLT